VAMVVAIERLRQKKLSDEGKLALAFMCTSGGNTADLFRRIC